MLDNPLIGEGLALAMGLAGETEIRRMLAVAEESNVLLTELFRQAGIELVELKIEFGRAADNGEVIISDEISPDTCRLWDLETGERLDKDRFRLDLGDVVPAYKTVLERLTAVLQQASSGEDAENSTEASGQQE